MPPASRATERAAWYRSNTDSDREVRHGCVKARRRTFQWVTTHEEPGGDVSAREATTRESPAVCCGRRWSIMVRGKVREFRNPGRARSFWAAGEVAAQGVWGASSGDPHDAGKPRNLTGGGTRVRCEGPRVRDVEERREPGSAVVPGDEGGGRAGAATVTCSAWRRGTSSWRCGACWATGRRCRERCRRLRQVGSAEHAEWERRWLEGREIRGGGVKAGLEKHGGAAGVHPGHVTAQRKSWPDPGFRESAVLGRRAAGPQGAGARHADLRSPGRASGRRRGRYGPRRGAAVLEPQARQRARPTAEASGRAGLLRKIAYAPSNQRPKRRVKPLGTAIDTYPKAVEILATGPGWARSSTFPRC